MTGSQADSSPVFARFRAKIDETSATAPNFRAAGAASIP
jgi:hypothetical protein